jgi:hypothetical protein
MNVGMDTLPLVALGVDAATYDNISTHHSIYVPGKFLPLLLAQCLTPKEALLVINVEAVAQNKQDVLKPLIDWLRAAVTHTAVHDTAPNSSNYGNRGQFGMRFAALHRQLQGPTDGSKPTACQQRL